MKDTKIETFYMGKPISELSLEERRTVIRHLSDFTAFNQKQSNRFSRDLKKEVDRLREENRKLWSALGAKE